ncbi:MAG: serine/threonine-protein kinase [Candidatus Moranbacteria bacterium]|nr:serine/threonine-protein kinase [Candidatus Moranbacteria bacterium]
MQLLNQTINGYRIDSFINKGGFGAVYKATKDEFTYAIKIFNEDYLLREFKKHGEKDNRLQREIDIMKSVSHELLVRYIDDFVIEDEAGKNFFLVMEYIDGKNLREILNENEKLKEEDAVILFKQILEGLDYLHNLRGDGEDIGIIHRDLKPENILVQNNGRIKIVDFGISKVIDFTSITSTGEVFGTGPYMSPEQITDSKHIDKRSDLYTAGVILYEMLTGFFPYDFQYQPELLDKIKNDPAIPPRRRNHEISNKIENIILKLLEKNPYQRFTKIKEVLDTIDAVAGNGKIKKYDLSPRFILRLYNDKSVLEEFTDRNKDFGWVDFPANLEVNQPGLKEKIQKDENIKIIIDPATVRLAYPAYAETRGVRELPYAPTDYSVITPETLRHYSDQKVYVKKVIDKQIELDATSLVSPFHYIHNSSVGFGPDRNLIAEWFDLDCKLAKESIDYRDSFSPDKEIYMGVCIRADFLNDKRSKKHFLNVLSSFDTDGFLIYADCIDNKTPETTLYNYIDFLIELQMWTKKPVIAGRVNAGLGIGLLSFGISSFTSGTARFESFYEGLYSETSESYNMYVRYFFPELLSTISINRRTPTKFDEIANVIGTCSCYYCNGKSNPEIIKDKNANLHFLENIYSEINKMESLSQNDKVDAFLLRIDDALTNYNNLRSVFKSDDYLFLNKWKNVFTKLKEKYYV